MCPVGWPSPNSPCARRACTAPITGNHRGRAFHTEVRSARCDYGCFALEDTSRVARLGCPSAFLRIVQRTSSPSTSPWESSPTHLAVCFGPTLPRVEHGPPSWFLTTLTGSSSRGFAGLLRPAADHEVHRVAALAAASRRTTERSHRCHTLQSIPLPNSRTRVTASPCPRAVTGCEPGPTSRPCSVRESVAPHTVAGVSRPWLSWAFPS